MFKTTKLFKATNIKNKKKPIRIILKTPFFIGIIERILYTSKNKITERSPQDTIVEIAAPINPYLGIRNIFRRIFSEKTLIKFINIKRDFPDIKIRLFKSTINEENKPPIERILKAGAASRNPAPNKMLIIVSGKIKIIKNIGIFNNKIHLPTC